MKNCPNVEVNYSKSGKFSTEIAQDWFKKVFRQELNDHRNQQSKIVLILDAWTGQGKNAELEKYTQPLDLYFFRQYKILVKNLTEACRDYHFKDNSVAKPKNRYFIMRLHCVCYNQIQHERFQRMWRYAWREAGFELETPHTHFENLNEILVKPVIEDNEARCTAHNDIPLIKCVYCYQITKLYGKGTPS